MSSGADSSGRDAFRNRLRQAQAKLGDQPFLILVNAVGKTKIRRYGALMQQAEAWAARYHAAGYAPGSRIVVILPHSLELYESYLGALIGGYCPAFFAPPSDKVSSQDYAGSVAFLLDHIGADCIVTNADIRLRLVGEMQRFYGFDDSGAHHQIGPAPDRSIEPGPAPYLFMQFSSGTTGIKKGVGISADALLWQVDTYARTLNINDSAKIATWLPLYHDMGLITCFFLPLLIGVPVVALSPFNWVKRPSMLLDIISQSKATHCWLPNFAFNFLAGRIAPSDTRHWKLDSLRAVVNCSEPILADSHRAFLDRFSACGLTAKALSTCYAMAESTFALTSAGGGGDEIRIERIGLEGLQRNNEVKLATGDIASRESVSSGRPLPETIIKIMSTEGEPLPEGFLGEIAVTCPSLFNGYLQNPEATAQSLRDGVFHTGDLGYLRNGALFVLGRIKDTIIIGGKNIYPQDIEEACNTVPGAIGGRNVAFGIDNPQAGTQNLIVIVETDLTDAVEQARLRDRIRQKIVSKTDIVPTDIATVPHMWLRKSTSGKISRSINRDRYLEVIYSAARPPLQHAEASVAAALVRQIVTEIATGSTSASDAGIKDTTKLIADGWIDSFSYVTLLTRIEEHFGAACSDRMRSDPDRYQTVAQILDLVGADTGSTPGADTAIDDLAEPDLRHRLAPQLKDVDQQPIVWVPYLMRRAIADYRSASTNTDRLGCRVSWRRGEPVDHDMLVRTGTPRGIVLGNSFVFGVGTTHDSRHIASQLNDLRAGGDICWSNFGLRASNLTQERLAYELYAAPPAAHVLWISGVNNLIPLIIDEGFDPNPAPFLGERIFASTMAHRTIESNNAPSSARYKAMLRITEIDISAVAMRQAGVGPVTFCLQPSASWLDKPLTGEELELLENFDAHGAAVRKAHHPKFLAQYYPVFSRDVEKICAKWGVKFVDLNKATTLKQPEWLLLDRIHMTDRGHRVVAEEVASLINQATPRHEERRVVL